MPPSANDRKRKENGQFIRKKNVKASVDEFLRISLTREGVGKNVTQPKGDSRQVENRSK